MKGVQGHPQEMGDSQADGIAMADTDDLICIRTGLADGLQAVDDASLRSDETLSTWKAETIREFLDISPQSVSSELFERFCLPCPKIDFNQTGLGDHWQVMDTSDGFSGLLGALQGAGKHGFYGQSG